MSHSQAVWREPGFLADARAWISGRLETLGAHPTGEIQQIHDRPWSTVSLVPTDRGRLFFKANAPAFRHEAALVAFLAGRRSDVVPPPLAVDIERGWMLMDDAGERLRELVARDRDLSGWLQVLPLYASLQADVADSSDALVALGVPDLRLAVLPARFEALVGALERRLGASGLVGTLSERDVRRLRDAVPRVSAMCAELAAYGVPESIEHDDLHDAAVYVRDGRHRILDWGDACVSHPFLSLSVALEGVIAWGVDDVAGSVDTTPFLEAYLEAFASPGGVERLRPAAALALRLGWVCRAVNSHLSGADEDLGPRLRMFLDGHP